MRRRSARASSWTLATSSQRTAPASAQKARPLVDACPQPRPPRARAVAVRSPHARAHAPAARRGVRRALAAPRGEGRRSSRGAPRPQSRDGCRRRHLCTHGTPAAATPTARGPPPRCARTGWYAWRGGCARRVRVSRRLSEGSSCAARTAPTPEPSAAADQASRDDSSASSMATSRALPDLDRWTSGRLNAFGCAVPGSSAHPEVCRSASTLTGACGRRRATPQS